MQPLISLALSRPWVTFRSAASDCCIAFIDGVLSSLRLRHLSLADAFFFDYVLGLFDIISGAGMGVHLRPAPNHTTLEKSENG